MMTLHKFAGITDEGEELNTIGSNYVEIEASTEKVDKLIADWKNSDKYTGKTNDFLDYVREQGVAITPYGRTARTRDLATDNTYRGTGEEHDADHEEESQR